METITAHGKEMYCSDGQVRQCFPLLAAWIADHVENEILPGLKRMSCAVCEVPVERLGSDKKENHPTRDHDKYAAIEERYVNIGDEDNMALTLAAGVKMGWTSLPDSYMSKFPFFSNPTYYLTSTCGFSSI